MFLSPFNNSFNSASTQTANVQGVNFSGTATTNGEFTSAAITAFTNNGSLSCGIAMLYTGFGGIMTYSFVLIASFIGLFML